MDEGLAFPLGAGARVGHPFRCGDRDVCRVVVEAAGRPTYVHDGATSRLVVRLGNSTRELDVREAMEYVSYRFGRVPKPRQLFGAPT